MYSTNQDSFDQRDNKFSTIRLTDATKEINGNKIIKIHNNGTLARNVIIFGVVNLASYFTENGSNNFFIVESGPALFVEDTKNFLSYLHKSKF